MRRVRILAAFGVVITMTGLWAAAASAHVTVQPPTAIKGARTILTFRVPNEKKVASIGLRVSFPKDHPFTSARVKPVPGWTYKITPAKLDTPVTGEGGAQITEYISEIEWSGGRIAPDEFQEFEVSAGPLPKDTSELTFPTIQIYEDEEVRWVEERVPGQPDPTRPEPRLTLLDAPVTTTTAPGVDPVSDPSEAALSSADDASDTAESAQTLAGVALAVGIVSLLVGVGAFLAKSRRAS